jgi:fucose 4-O-acetylase-like acetyltransferase
MFNLFELVRFYFAWHDQTKYRFYFAAVQAILEGVHASFSKMHQTAGLLPTQIDNLHLAIIFLASALRRKQTRTDNLVIRNASPR